MPLGVRPDRVLRAIAGLVLFSAAYMAENVPGGATSCPPGASGSGTIAGVVSPPW
ncbi:hypothetical protein [Neosynechococcus sphagnicola]|uniref:hypothetical protein n=1 Tax=Neosynechococcus sphagnicola TaxID=1501145 RepID=UPI001EF9E02B|nr:hypothetical protein [Neosynechococcus sphagnicola]